MPPFLCSASLNSTTRRLGDEETAKGFLNRVMETFPETRHSANARHKLNEIEQAAQRHH